MNQLGIKFLLDGTNADDLKTYRPGLRATREAKIITPFALLGWTKKEIRAVSRSLGLPTWNQPSSPCMATRVAYGQSISLPLLKRLARGEEYSTSWVLVNAAYECIILYLESKSLKVN